MLKGSQPSLLGCLAATPLCSPLATCLPDRCSSRLSNVLENGNGSPGSLAVLYLELCSRLSLPLQPVALEGGRWAAAAWPRVARQPAAQPLCNSASAPGIRQLASAALCLRYLFPMPPQLSTPSPPHLAPAPAPPCRYFVLMPADDSISLKVAGESIVIDPYSEGMLLSVSEVSGLHQ